MVARGADMDAKRSSERVKQRTPKAYGAGFVALDLLLSLESPEQVAAYAGGTCGNVLTILAYLGWDSFPITRIGLDPAGMALRSDLRRWGVRDDFLLEEDSFVTPIVVQQNRRLKNGDVSHRFIWQCPSCGKYLPTFRPVTKSAASELLAKADTVDTFFFDRVAPATLALAEASAQRGAVVVFEPSSYRDDKLFEKALRIAHIVKYSRERLSGVRLPRASRPYLQIETLGKAGLRYRFKGQRWKTLEGFAIGDVADTSGAGDWCTAGTLSRIAVGGMAGLPDDEGEVREALMYGQRLSAINCRYEGARGLMYRLSQKQLNRAVESLRESSAVKAFKASPVLQQVYKAAYCQSCWPG